ncbi:MAG TPA: acyl-CoA dehydrogenase family protein [Ktedonobacteraceae bacterium]|nr:acyl-CoA dehydrogenase family protein [Ktedonobacteraceae bacterium]
MTDFFQGKSSRATFMNGQKQDTGLSDTPGYVDYYSIEDLLTEEEKSVRERVRRFCDQEVIPRAAEYWDRAEVPFELLKKLATLNIVGGTIKGYGCPGLSPVAVGLAIAELTRGDGSLNTTIGVHSGLAMAAIAHFGSPEQKEQWLPGMARLEKIGAFALTEPEHGSDAFSFETSVSRDGDSWVINGAKKWIGNASFADVVVVWARHKTGQVGAFLVEKGTPGFTAQVITGKGSQRASWQTHITLENVRVPISHRLANVSSFNDFTSVALGGRCEVAWTALGHAIACYEHALAYTKKRVQFGKPIAHFQLVQQKLARMLAEITCLQLLCLRASQLLAAKKLTLGTAALAKMQAAYKARQIAADARDLLGANGILLEYHVIKHQADLETIFTGEGTDHIQSLIIGREITGIQAFS